jgi:hypothetical protein
VPLKQTILMAPEFNKTQKLRVGASSEAYQLVQSHVAKVRPRVATISQRKRMSWSVRILNAWQCHHTVRKNNRRRVIRSPIIRVEAGQSQRNTAGCCGRCGHDPPCVQLAH